MSAQAVAALERDKRVLWVEPEAVYTTAAPKPVPPPPLDFQLTPSGVDRVEADRNRTARIDGNDQRIHVNVAILDTGIDLSHPDLNVVGGFNCSGGDSFQDLNGHGTHVAGTVGALDNTFGVVGVAPGVPLWSVPVLNKAGNGSAGTLLCGLDWITSTRTDADPSNDIQIANMSLSYTGPHEGDDGNCGLTNQDAIHLAVCNVVASGITLVAAAGNASIDAVHTIPAAYSEVIAVSALADTDGKPGGLGPEFAVPRPGAVCSDGENDDTFAFFSNYGSVIDLIAPGLCIRSTYLQTAGFAYATTSGTSMAAPHVSGAAALFKANNPTATPAQVMAALIQSGSFDWDNADDPDGVQEPLLDVRHT